MQQFNTDELSMKEMDKRKTYFSNLQSLATGISYIVGVFNVEIDNTPMNKFDPSKYGCTSGLTISFEQFGKKQKKIN